MIRFDRFVLRTFDVAAAGDFYAAVLGEGRADIVPLPAAAAARGAPAHWLGHLGVADFEAKARAFVERGAVRLGPPAGGEAAILRDPGGAVVALAPPPATPPRAGVVWYQLNTPDVARAQADYAALFGFHPTARADLGPLGVHHHFAFAPGGPAVGSMSDTRTFPGIHPHWLFHFGVAALEPALAEIRARKGIIVRQIDLPNGDRVAVCDDPQGAAFAIRASRAS